MKAMFQVVRLVDLASLVLVAGRPATFGSRTSSQLPAGLERYLASEVRPTAAERATLLSGAPLRLQHTRRQPSRSNSIPTRIRFLGAGTLEGPQLRALAAYLESLKTIAARPTMNETVHIENAVLGGGEAGKYLAWDLAQQGRPVVVIERALIGGSCPNIACLPSKNVIRSAKVADLVSRAASYGVRIEGATVDMKGVRQRKREMVDGMIAIHRQKFAVPHLEFLLAEGILVGPRTVEARLPDGGSRRFVADRLFLNLGTRATIPGVPGLADARPLTHVEALELDRLPSHLIVLGGGYVGVEFAQAFRRFGSRVTVLEFGTQLLGREDPDVAAAVLTIFEEDGIDVVLGAETQVVEGRSGEAVRLRVKTPAGDRTIEGSDILVAAGRTPNTREIGLEQAGIELDARGFVKVDDRLQATAAGVWAMGECAGSPQFTHVAFDDFRVVRDNLAGKCGAPAIG